MVRMTSQDSLKIAYRDDLQSSDPSAQTEKDVAHLLPTIRDSQEFARHKKESDGAPASGAAAGAAEQSKDSQSKDSKGAACPVSNTYNTLIDKAWRNVYDPTPLGDLAALKNKYNCQIKNPAEAFRFVNQELSRIGDHYNTVLNPTQVKQLDRQMAGATTGLGLEVTSVDPEKAKETGSLKVYEVIPGSSAAQMGVKKGDYITSIDNVDLTTKSSDDALAILQENKSHRLSVLRDGKKLDIWVSPTALDMPAVVDRMIPGTNIAYIRIRDFMQNDQSYELQNAIKRYPLVDGFIFDVRGNPGGAVDQALQSASMVVDKGKLLSTRMRHEDDKPSGAASYDRTDYMLDEYELVQRDVMPNGSVKEKRDLRLPDIVNKPSVVLVDGGTASAAEIFAAALQQNDEATLIGNQTFGKGIGQTVFFDQPAGSRLQVTNFRFYTPNNDWIGDAAKNRIGITPDQVIENAKYSEPETESDKQFRAAIAAINKKLGK